MIDGLNEWPSECCHIQETEPVTDDLDWHIQEVASLANGLRVLHSEGGIGS